MFVSTANHGLGMLGARNAYPTANAAPTNGVQAPTAHMQRSTETESGWRTAISPSNPLLWLGLFVAAAAGLAGVAGSAKVGPIRASASVGKAS